MGQRGYLSELFVSFQGEGLHAGRRHLFVRLAGCNLRCRYCDTPGSLERSPTFRVVGAGSAPRIVPNPVQVRELEALLRELLDQAGEIDGVALTGGEPLTQAPFLAELLGSAALPRPRLLETNGMLPDRLASVLPWIDVVSMDVKLPSNTGEEPFWDEHARFLEMARGRVYVKVLVDDQTRPAELERAAAVIQRIAPETPLFLQPISDPEGRITTDGPALEAFFRLARERLADVRISVQMHKLLSIA